MKSFLKVIVLFLIFMVIAYSSPLINREDSTALFKNYDAKQGNLKMKVDSKETPIKYNEEKSIAKYIGKPFSLIEKKYGKPNRMYATPYEYDNYVYNKGQEGYLIVGVKADKVVRFYVAGNKIPVSPFTIDMPSDQVINRFDLQTEIMVESPIGKYQLSLAEDDLYSRPLLKISKGIYAQLTMDATTHKLFSVSFMDSETLVKMRPYESVYDGDIYEPPKFSDKQWVNMNRGMSLDVEELTNLYREKEGLNPLKLDKNLTTEAELHSKDMYENEFFNHESPDRGDLTTRLAHLNKNNVDEQENLAANYVDGIATFGAWLNSPNHLQKIRTEKANIMGVGGYRFYLTQIIVEEEQE